MHRDPPQLSGHRTGRCLGRGGSGEVWSAWPEADDGSLGPAVAIKRRHVIDGRRGELPVHPNVLSILEVHEGDDPLVVLPLLPGGTLGDLLGERGALTAGEVAALMTAVVAGVEALHGAGLVHGDLTAANVLLEADGTPVVGDVDDLQLGRGTPAAGGEWATPAYLAPERAEDPSAPPTTQGDAFSLGVIAYECLTGIRPHRGTPAQVLAAAATGARRPLAAWPSVPSAMAGAVERALAADPALRPDDLGAWAGELRAAVPSGSIVLPGPALHPSIGPVDAPASETTVAVGPALADVVRAAHPDGAQRDPEAPPSSSRPTRRFRPLRRSPRSVVAGVAAVVGVAAAIAASVDRDPGPPPEPLPAGDASPERPPATTTEIAACDAPRTGSLPEGEPLSARLAGEGCLAEVVWADGVLHVAVPDGVRRYALGDVGDRVLLGDWDGDGTDEPALHRRSRREVWYLEAFPAEVGDRLQAVAVQEVAPSGNARVAPRADGPGQVVVVEP